jgi:hypothetical protein
MPIRRNKLLNRRENYRDATLFVIATEGQETERQYFDGFNASLVKVIVLPTGEDGKSSPESVVSRVADFQRQFDLGNEDELWVVLDVDRWKARQLHDICRSARGKYKMAVSNPCFELWLFLHLAEPNFSGEEWDAVLWKAHQNPSRAMKLWLRKHLAEQGGYQENNLQFERFHPSIPEAIERAKALDVDPTESYPQTFPGTHVYRLAERLRSFLTATERNNIHLPL